MSPEEIQEMDQSELRCNHRYRDPATNRIVTCPMCLERENIALHAKITRLEQLLAAATNGVPTQNAAHLSTDSQIGL